MKYNLLNELNEAIEQKPPVITAGVLSGENQKQLSVLDVRFLDKKNIVEDCRRVIAQAMHRWNPQGKVEYTFSERDQGLLKGLGISITAPDKKSSLEISIGGLSDADVEKIKQLYT